MRLVIDASVVANIALGNTRPTKDELHAPTVIDYELLNTLRRQVRIEALTTTQARDFIWFIDTWALRRHDAPRLLHRAWEIRDNFSAYDATYVALAELLGATLWTHDIRLARAAQRYCDVVTN